MDAEERQPDQEEDESGGGGDQQPGMTRSAQRLPANAPPEDEQSGRGGQPDHEHGRKQHSPCKGKVGDPDDEHDECRHEGGCRNEPDAHGSKGYARWVVEANYVSGDDYVIEFQDHRFGFNAADFEQRVTAAAVKLGLVADNELDEDETADLVELVWRDWIEEPRSGLGRYLVRHWERVSLVNGESLVYWLKKLVFRSAWLDHRVKEGILDVAWDEDIAEFAYRDPNGDRALLELAPVPSWPELQFRR